MTSIFISHSRYDTWFTDPLKQNLKAIDIEPILLEFESPLPSPLPDSIRNAISRSSAFLLLWTSQVAYNTTTRDNVMLEVGEAHALNKPILVLVEKNVALPMIIPYMTTYIEFDVHDQKEVEYAFRQVLTRTSELAGPNPLVALWLLLGGVYFGNRLAVPKLIPIYKKCLNCGKEVDEAVISCPKCGHKF